MKLDQLPVEMLVHILKFLPKYDECSLVNKLLYEVTCKAIDSRICLQIDRWMDSQCMQSIQRSKRAISKVEIDTTFQSDQRPIIQIIEYFSATIKFLRYKKAAMDESTFLHILSLTPNLEHLELEQISFRTAGQQLHKQCCFDGIHLTKLRSLSIVGCDHEFIGALNRLPVGPLTELRITDIYWDTMGAAFSRLQKSKKKKLRRRDCEVDTFDDLNLECLGLKDDFYNFSELRSDRRRANLVEILSQQTKLKSLILSDGRAVDDQIMSAVANLMELEILGIDVTNTPVQSFEKIGQLKKLADFKLLCVNSDCDAKFKILSESNNNSLRKLSLEWQIGISSESVAVLAKSSPNLKQLKVTIAPLRQANRMQLDVIMSHFNFIEILQLINRDRFIEQPLVNQSHYFNPNLREFSYTGDGQFYESWMPQFIASYPNLTKLKLIFFCPRRNQLQIRSILNGFAKLESLILHTDELIVDDLDHLQYCKGNLKFVSLGRIDRVTLTEEMLEKLGANFGVVNVDDSGRLSMAIDQYRMDCGRDEYF